MTDYPPPQYPDQNPSGWPPPAQPGPADEREQSSTPSDQTWYSTEPPTTIAPVPPTPPTQAYPASPAYGQATPAGPAYGQATPASPAYGQATPAYPASPPAYPGYPTDPYTVPADPYPTTPYPPAPAPAGYPYGQTSAPPYGQPSGPPYGYGQVMQPAVALVVAPPASGAATASMILGIVGLVLGCFLCGIPSVLAIIFGHIGLNQTKNDVKSGRGQAIAGLVMGYVLIVPTIIGTIFFLGYLGVFGAAAATSSAGY